MGNHVLARLAKLVVVVSLASAQATRQWWCSSCPVETVLLLPWLLNQLPQAGFYCFFSCAVFLLQRSSFRTEFLFIFSALRCHIFRRFMDVGSTPGQITYFNRK